MTDAVARFLFDPPGANAAVAPVLERPPATPWIERPNWAGQRMSTNIEDRREELPDFWRDYLREIEGINRYNIWDLQSRIAPPVRWGP